MTDPAPATARQRGFSFRLKSTPLAVLAAVVPVGQAIELFEVRS